MARLLLVDDDPVVRELLVTTLDFGEHELEQAADGPSALASFVRRAADVVVLDLDLPGMDGVEILARLRELGAPRVVVLTGAGRGREPLLRSLGAFGYLTKPFSPLALVSEIEAALA